jgi:hypothetical protein
MRKILLSLVALAALLLPLQASAAAAGPRTVVVGMHDPGCHWFVTGSTAKSTTVRSYAKSLTVRGPMIRLLNIDEAALKVVGPHGVKFVRVGKLLPLKGGIYHITMVGQAPDDNHLLLTVK